VTVATSALPDRRERVIDGVRVEEFAVEGNAVRGMRGEVERYRDFVLGGRFDVVMSYAAQQWATDALLPVIGEIPYAKVLAPCGFSGLYDPTYADYFRRLPEALAMYDRLIFHSNGYRDIEFARRAGLETVSVVPNGAAREEFERLDAGDFRSRHGIPSDLPLLLTVGGHTGQKGHEIVIEAVRRMQGSAALVLAGNRPLGSGCSLSCRLRGGATRLLTGGKRRVHVVDLERQQLLAAYAAADAFVFASRIECSPLVLFEAMASGTPFVTSPAGNAEEIAEWSGGGLVVAAGREPGGEVVGDPAELARAVESLVHDPELAARLGRSGRDAWLREFTWDTIARRYESIYAEAAEPAGVES
jgi:glycosyltransferase involved in cell wall biosynthesis